MLTFRFTGADGCMEKEEILTSGMIGKKVRLEFSAEWANLKKTAVFTAGPVTRDVLDVTDEVEIPAEVLAVPLMRLHVGVYGVSSDGKVTPTIRVQGPIIEQGADPSGDEGARQELPVWAQILAMIGDLRNLTTEAKANLVAAINEVQSKGGGSGGIDENTLQAAINAALAQAMESGEFDGPKGDPGEKGEKGDLGIPGEPGPAGEDGKSAYAYAKEGGYTGTEEEFAELMANGSPDAVQYVPQTLTEEQKAQARENIGAASIDSAVPEDVRLAIYRILSAAVTTEPDLSEHLAAVYAWAGSPDEPTVEYLEFDLIEGQVTYKDTYIKYWANINGSQPARMEMNPVLVRYDPEYQYTVKMSPTDIYYMQPHWLTFDNTTDNFVVDGTENVAWTGNAALINYQNFYGGELIIPACDVFFVHLGRKDKANLTDEDKAWLRQNFTVERVRV